ncbi:hypothetical protein BROOK1789C_1872 [Bathymodiolus brooksi thiotrophic gill symbiont]|nr:hypothetical protein BROOK1789B_1902 [Bathymodiolus brooksi thiotrophic gill symbiont]CAB9544676.1 hypothetical protein BROOK1789C_1872 [Bathymodiolus brooksi thiotrophic gill symbiont]
MLGIDSADQLTCHIHSKSILSYVMFLFLSWQYAKCNKM